MPGWLLRNAPNPPSTQPDDFSQGVGSAGEPFSLRWIYTHMIEEYARHNGHADLVRDRVDGATGD